MIWLLAMLGFALSLFLPGGSADRYYQGLAHSAAILGSIWLELHLMTKLMRKFMGLLIAVAGLFAAHSYRQSLIPKAHHHVPCAARPSAATKTQCVPMGFLLGIGHRPKIGISDVPTMI